MGPRQSALHGSDAVPSADQFTRQAVRATGRRHALYHNGEKQAQTVRGGAGVSRRAGPVVSVIRDAIRKLISLGFGEAEVGYFVQVSANGMVRPCSCPASDRSWQGAPKTRSTPCLRYLIPQSP